MSDRWFRFVFFHKERSYCEGELSKSWLFFGVGGDRILLAVEMDSI